MRRLGEGVCPPPCPLPGATPQSAAADSSPCTGEPKTTPQSRCGVTAPLTQGSRSNPSVTLRRTAPIFAPKRPFGTFRCFAWLIRIKEHTVLFYSKRSRFSRGAACARGSRSNPSVRCGGQLPLHRGAKEVRSVRCDGFPYMGGEPKRGLQRGDKESPRPGQRAGVFSRVSRPRSMRRGTSVAWPPSCQVMVTREAPSCRVSNSSSRR